MLPSRVGYHLLENRALLDQGLDAVLRLGAAFQQNPTVVIHLYQQTDQALVGIAADVQFADVGGGPEAVLDEVKIILCPCPSRSVELEFQHTPTLGWLAISIIALMVGSSEHSP